MISYEQLTDAPLASLQKETAFRGQRNCKYGAIFCIVTSLLGCLVGQPRVYMAMVGGLMPKCIAAISGMDAGQREHVNVGVDRYFDLIIRYRYSGTNGFHWDVDYILLVNLAP